MPTDKPPERRTPVAGVPVPIVDRDVRRPLPSLPGVLPQAARFALPPEDWEEGKRATTAVGSANSKESPLETVLRRSGDTKNNTLETLDRVDALRRETGERYEKLEDKFGSIVEVVGVVKQEVAVTKGQNEVIISTLGKIIDQQGQARERSGMMRLTGFTASMEVEKQRQLTELGERVAWGATWRGTLIKVTAAVIAAISALGGAYLIGRG